LKFTVVTHFTSKVYINVSYLQKSLMLGLKAELQISEFLHSTERDIFRSFSKLLSVRAIHSIMLKFAMSNKWNRVFSFLQW